MTAELHSTTFKVKRDIANGIRIMAALKGESVADLAQEAVARILAFHDQPSFTVEHRSNNIGRRSTTLREASEMILRSRPEKNEALPTRIPTKAAKTLSKLAPRINSTMAHLAEAGARKLLEEGGPDIAKAIAGLSGEDAHQRAMAAVSKIVSGELTEAQFRKIDVIGANAGAKQSLSRRRTKTPSKD